MGAVTYSSRIHHINFKMVLVVREDGDNVVVECTASNMILMHKPKGKVGFNVHEEVSKLNLEVEK